MVESYIYDRLLCVASGDYQSLCMWESVDQYIRL